MLGKVRVRERLASIRLRVWGWEQPEADANATTLGRIIEYIENAFWNGLGEEDMMDDIIDKFPAYFEDGEVEIDDGDHGDTITVVLAPVG